MNFVEILDETSNKRLSEVEYYRENKIIDEQGIEFVGVANSTLSYFLLQRYYELKEYG